METCIIWCVRHLVDSSLPAIDHLQTDPSKTLFGVVNDWVDGMYILWKKWFVQFVKTSLLSLWLAFVLYFFILFLFWNYSSTSAKIKCLHVFARFGVHKEHLKIFTKSLCLIQQLMFAVLSCDPRLHQPLCAMLSHAIHLRSLSYDDSISTKTSLPAD